MCYSKVMNNEQYYGQEFIDDNEDHYSEWLRCEVAVKDSLTELELDSMTNEEAYDRYNSRENRKEYLAKHHDAFMEYVWKMEEDRLTEDPRGGDGPDD